MVAKINYVASSNSGVMADYYLKPTQPEWERNQDLEYQLHKIPDHVGTVPIFQPHLPRQVVDAFRLDMDAMRADPHPQMRNLFAGLRADGGPTGKREMSAYIRQDGREFTQKKYFDITVSNHVSIGIAMANAETPAGRALIYSAALEANSHAVGKLANRIGWTRQGAAGSGGEVRAHPLIITFPHHAARPTQSGFVAPNLHFHNIVFSPVATEEGRVGSLNTIKFGNESIIKAKFDYHDRLENNLNLVGVNTKRREIGDIVLSNIPNNVNDFFSQRSTEILDRARENAQKRGEDFNNLSAERQNKYVRIASRQTRGSSEDGIADTRRWRFECMRMNWSAQDLPRLAMNMVNSFIESNLKDDYRRTWQQTRQAVEQAKIRQQHYAFNVRVRRQIVAAALALKLDQFQPKKSDLVQEFANLAKSFTEHKSRIADRLTGRKLVHSLTPTLVELQRMSTTLAEAQQPPRAQAQTQPLQKDHESLGAYLAQKHKLPAEYGPRLAAAGSLIADGRMHYQDAVNALMGNKYHLQDRLDRAVGDAASFYNTSTVSGTFTVVGSYKPTGPVVFTTSYGDAAMARDATAGKISIVSGYNEENLARSMSDWRETMPRREFIRLADASSPTTTPDLPNTVTMTPPKNAAQAQTWQDYSKNYGADAVGSNMRQAYRQEFRQSQGPKFKQAAE